MMTTNHENHEKLSPGVASVRQRPPASFSASAKSGFVSIERSFTFSLPRHQIFHPICSVQCIGWNMLEPETLEISTWKKTWLPGFKLQAIELYDMATKKWIYISYGNIMGISWLWRCGRKSAIEKPMGILRLSHNLQTTPYLNHTYSRKISTTLGQTFGCGTSPI